MNELDELNVTEDTLNTPINRVITAIKIYMSSNLTNDISEDKYHAMMRFLDNHTKYYPDTKSEMLHALCNSLCYHYTSPQFVKSMEKRDADSRANLECWVNQILIDVYTVQQEWFPKTPVVTAPTKMH